MILRLIAITLVVVVALFYYNNFIVHRQPNNLSPVSGIATMGEAPVVLSSDDEEFEKIKARTLKEFEAFQATKRLPEK
ncbi:MAG TPA: hypothetical protein ENK06_04010 [Gammaproteobacteria bacterium]|nr:hypothetical protein [Gammaproteobacteria bacterium]